MGCRTGGGAESDRPRACHGRSRQGCRVKGDGLFLAPPAAGCDTATSGWRPATVALRSTERIMGRPSGGGCVVRRPVGRSGRVTTSVASPPAPKDISGRDPAYAPLYVSSYVSSYASPCSSSSIRPVMASSDSRSHSACSRRYATSSSAPAGAPKGAYPAGGGPAAGA